MREREKNVLLYFNNGERGNAAAFRRHENVVIGAPVHQKPRAHTSPPKHSPITFE